MNIDDKVDYAEKLNNEKDEFEIMKDILMLIPEERIDSVIFFFFFKFVIKNNLHIILYRFMSMQMK